MKAAQTFTQGGPTATLLYPPFFGDFRGPYLTMPQLLGFLHSKGITDVAVEDVNIRMWKVLKSPAMLEQLRAQAMNEIAVTRNGPALQDLIHQKLLLDYLLEDPARLDSDNKSARLFSGLILNSLFDQLRRNIDEQMASLEKGISAPFMDPVLDEVVQGISESSKLVGITVPTADQFYPALALAMRVRRKFGNRVHIALGGSIFALLAREKAEDVLHCPYVDSITLHEGELTIVKLYEMVHGKCAIEDVPNLIFLKDGQPVANAIIPAPLLNNCPPPAFPPNVLAQYDKDIYLPLWATRGCYWGKCTFCDYVHLSSNNNHAETIRVKSFVDQIGMLREQYGIDKIQAISECLSPSFCSKLASMLIEREYNIKWTTHLKIEKQFTQELCHKMYQSGCESVTIGVESFNNRMLGVMKKGTKQQDIINMLTSLTNAGIEAHINIIVDYPSCRKEEAVETLKALVQHRAIYASANVFPFVLSNLSDVARNPSQYDIEVIQRAAENHRRGFHFSEFRRTAGMTDAEAQEMLVHYLRFSLKHGRLRVQENALQLLDEHELGELLLSRQQHFIAISDEEHARFDGGKPAGEIQEGMVRLFDLVAREVVEAPALLWQLNQLLPQEWMPAQELQSFFETGDEEQKFLQTLVRAGVNNNLFALRLDHEASKETFLDKAWMQASDVLAHVRKKLETAQLTEDRIQVKDIFPREHYEAVCKYFPSLPPQKTMNLDLSRLRKLDWKAEIFWKEQAAWLQSDEFMEMIMSKFKDRVAFLPKLSSQAFLYQTYQPQANDVLLLQFDIATNSLTSDAGSAYGIGYKITAKALQC